jgi:hypothetical protein
MTKAKQKLPLQSPELRAYLACLEAHVASSYGDMAPRDPGYDAAEAITVALLKPATPHALSSRTGRCGPGGLRRACRSRAR